MNGPLRRLPLRFLVYVSLVGPLAPAACGDDAEPAGGADTSDSASDTSSDTSDTAADSAPDTATDAIVDTADNQDAPDIGPDGIGDTTTDTGPPPGPRVGYRSGSISYDPTDGSGTRTLRIAYWYPTDDESGATVTYSGFVPAPGVLGDAFPSGGAAPVVVFSHGNQGFAEQSFFLTEHLARHGYLVVAPDHTGNTFGSPADPTIFRRRPEDISAVIDHLRQLEALPADDPLAALVGEHIAVAGHSFGGYTALTVGGGAWDVDGLLAECAVEAIPLDGCDSLAADEAMYRAGFLDARLEAILAMSPGAISVFGADGLRGVAPPTLLMTAALDKTTTNENDGDPAWEQLSGSAENLRLDFATAGHFTFSDACSLPIEIGLDNGCGEGFIPAAQAHAAINAYALAFFDRELRGDDSGSALLSGELVIEPDITLSRGGR